MSTRTHLIATAEALDPLLDAYQLSALQLARHLTGETPSNADPDELAALQPVVDRLVETHGVDLDALAEHLVNPTGETVNDVVDLADQLLKGRTRSTWMSKLRFFADGWSVQPIHLPDAIAAAEQAELHLNLSDDPDDYPSFDETLKTMTRTRLVLWEGYGHLPIKKVLRSRIEIAMKYKRADTLARGARRDRKRADRGLPSLGWTGDGAVAGLHEALCYLYGVARGDRLIDPTFDPLEDITKPGREECNRRSLKPAELRSLWQTVILHASDPALDRLLLKFLFHTGARREGAINLNLGRLDHGRQTVELLQKYGKKTEVPVCRSLLDELVALARSRGSTQKMDPVFRVNVRDHETGEYRPLSDKHFDTLHDKIQTNLDWAGKEGWTAHWARHHAKAQISQIAGPDVARVFLDHTPFKTTERYGPASFEHVAWAVSRMTGEPHPLAEKPHWID